MASVTVCIVYRRNILDTQNATYLKSCHYNSQSDVDRLCPIFTLGDIVRETQTSPNDTYSSIALLVCNLRLIHTHTGCVAVTHRTLPRHAVYVYVILACTAKRGTIPGFPE